jgi:pimeloyl-ACP methyl ester carboxylesterase
MPMFRTSAPRAGVRRVVCASVAAATVAALGIPPAAALEESAPTGNPVVLLHGWTGSGSGWSTMVTKLQAQGLTVLDMNPSAAGTQALSYAPTASGQHIPYVAGKIVQPAIQEALSRNGYPATQKVDIVAHSMGGLVARFLVEQPGADVDRWTSSGWAGDGVPDVRTDWASRVDRLVMLGTPNHGTILGWAPSTLPGFGAWSGTGADMRPGSVFLGRLGTREPSGERYVSIGGDPAHGQYLRYDFDGDGVRHGFDDVVPAESPYVVGAELDIITATHSELRSRDNAVDLVIGALGYDSTQTGSGALPLRGTATLRLEYAHIVADHDYGTKDENRFEFWVDTDGGSDSYRKLSTIAYDRDAPFAQNWGNSGPRTTSIALPGTASSVDVRVVVYEDDPFARDAVSTFYLRGLTQSEDRDGLDYYAATAADAKGGTNTLRVALLGVTSDPAA